MATRQNSFRHGRDIKNVLKKGDTFPADGLSIRRLGSQQSRLAIIVSKKVHKHAVVRNRIRRRISEVIRELRKHQPSMGDTVVVVKEAAIANQDYEVHKRNIVKILDRKQ